MKGRHALWSAIACDRGTNADTPDKREALTRWNEVTICERFHWTRDYYRSLPSDWLADAIAIMNVRDHYANQSSSPS